MCLDVELHEAAPSLGLLVDDRAAARRRDEAKALKSIAGIPPFHVVLELIRRVQADCAVEIDGNAYSVPWRLIGETVRATVMGGMVHIQCRRCCRGNRGGRIDRAPR